MNFFRINEIKLSAFALSSAEAGETVKFAIREQRISTEPLFYVYSIQLFNIAISKVKESTGKIIISDNINRALLIIHKDDTAKLYINDFNESIEIQSTRMIKAGEPIFLPDISDIRSVDFPGIDIDPTDKVFYLTRAGFIFGLCFNFTQKLERQSFGSELADLKKRLYFEDHLKKTTSDAFDFDAVILTEGKTDVMHLKRALVELGLKPDLNIQFDETEMDFGDANLLNACKIYARTPHKTPIICVFDRDNKDVIKELESKTEQGKAYQSWGNNVFSVLLPVPRHREGYKNISIEMYYKDEVIQQPDAEGKRLYFDNEIRTIVDPGKKTVYQVIPPDKDIELEKKVSDKKADSIINQQNQPCAISKNVFASRIFAGQIKDVDFSSFKELFAVIHDILRDAFQK